MCLALPVCILASTYICMRGCVCVCMCKILGWISSDGFSGYPRFNSPQVCVGSMEFFLVYIPRIYGLGPHELCYDSCNSIVLILRMHERIFLTLDWFHCNYIVSKLRCLGAGANTSGTYKVSQTSFIRHFLLHFQINLVLHFPHYRYYTWLSKSRNYEWIINSFEKLKQHLFYRNWG